MKTRIISGCFLAVIGFVTIYLGGPVLTATLIFCSLAGLYEMLRACGVIGEDKKVPLPAAAAFAGTVLYYLIVLFIGTEAALVTASLVILAVMASYVVTFPKYSSAQVISTCFAFVYVSVMLSYILMIRMEERGLVLVWLVFIASWGADTMAYFTGVAVGKHHMTPVLSPKKTWEGAVGGVLGAGVLGILFSVLFDHHQFLWQYFVVCSAGAVISIFGDLAASAIKRDRGIKDYGKLIPGHGGIMDRFDSVIFVSPVIYLLTETLIARL